MIKPLTSLRFIFAVMVLLHHLMPSVHYFFYEGFVGVSFFFILSGFILSHSYKRKFLEVNYSKRDFYYSRIARIYPLHLLTLGISVFFVGFTFTFDYFLKFILNFTLLQSFVPFPDFYFSFNAVSWSISDEMFFYLLFPFIIIFINKNKLIPKISISIFVILVLMLNVFLPESSKHAILYINPFLRIFDFILGIILYDIWEKNKDNVFFQKKATVFEIMVVLLFLLFYTLSVHIPLGYRYSIYYWPIISLLLFIFAFSKGFLSKVLSNNIFVVLGNSSFALYMIHLYGIKIIYALGSKFGINGVFYYWIIILLCIIASVVIYTLYEKPLNKIIRKKLVDEKFNK